MDHAHPSLTPGRGARPPAAHRPPERTRADDLIGSSPPMLDLLKQVAFVAPLDVSVLLIGPSGTGKTHLARVLHQRSRRAARDYVEVSCANLPDSLVESELFGAVAGAHSTAARAVEGKVAAADGGTLFLDEVAELPLASQAKLLQLLQSRTYYPLGASRPRAADLRVVAATNADLSALVQRRAFREDLYYRLNVFTLRVPSLAERRADIPALAEHFCARACARHGLPRITISPGSVQQLQAAGWPGNIRQLANAVETASIRAAAERSPQLEVRHLFPDRSDSDEPAARTGYHEATARFQAQLVRSTLEAVGWNVTEAARRLALTRAHLYNLLERFRLERPPQ